MTPKPDGDRRRDLPDDGAPDARGVPIDEVGIRRLRYPICVKDRSGQLQATVAEVQMAVGLPGHTGGIAMSRFIEVLNAYRGELTISVLPDLLGEVQRRLDAEDVSIRLDFPYFIDKAAPVSGARSLMAYRCGFRARRRGSELRFCLRVGVPVQRLDPGAHGQRSEIEVELESGDFVWIEDVVAAVEGCASAPVFALLEREDERWLTGHAAAHPHSVDDLVREVLSAVRRLPGVRRVRVAAESFESIHAHSAFATLDWRAGETDEPLDLPVQRASHEPEPFGQWLRACRASRALSQHELAERWGCSTSFVSRVESGAKTPGADSLVALAAALGHDPVKLQLRAGVVPAALLARIQAAPESFLRWAAQSPDDAPATAPVLDPIRPPR